jgi:hypothetical protein
VTRFPLVRARCHGHSATNHDYMFRAGWVSIGEYDPPLRCEIPECRKRAIFRREGFPCSKCGGTGVEVASEGVTNQVEKK